MIGSLITSQTRIKLLKKFFLNSNTSAHLRGLESEFCESTNAIRVELNRLEGAGLLTSHRVGNKKLYKANPSHPLYHDIHSIIMKEAGIDKIIDKVIHRIGNLVSVYVTGDFACGRDSNEIELLIIGDGIDKEYLERKILQAEKLIGRKVKYALLGTADAKEKVSYLMQSELLPIWNGGGVNNPA